MGAQLAVLGLIVAGLVRTVRREAAEAKEKHT
jgi:hypothetical protein